MIPVERAGDTLTVKSASFRWRLQDELEHRRNQVRELQGSGYNITEIAQKLQISVPTIKRDSAWLKQQAKENYQRHITERIAYDVENTLAFYRSIQKEAKEIASNTDNEAVKIKALALATEARKLYQDLELRGEYVKRAMDAAVEIKKRLDKLPNSSSNYSSQEEEGSDQQQNTDEEELEATAREEEEEEKEEQVYRHAE